MRLLIIKIYTHYAKKYKFKIKKEEKNMVVSSSWDEILNKFYF